MNDLNNLMFKKGDGLLINGFRFWLLFCQYYVLSQILRFAENLVGYASLSDPYSLPLLLSCVWFYRNCIKSWLSKSRNSVKPSPEA